MHHLQVRNFMNVESSSTIKSLLDFAKDGMLTLQQWLTILEKLEAASNQSPTDPTSATPMDQIGYRRICLDSVHLRSNCR